MKKCFDKVGKFLAAAVLVLGLALTPLAGLAVSASPAEAEEAAAKTVIDMTTTETRVEDGVTYFGAGAFYSAHVVAGTDFYDESGTTVTEASETTETVGEQERTYVTPATRVTSEDSWFTYRIIIPADTVRFAISIFQTQAGTVEFKNVVSGESATQTFSSYVNVVRTTELLSNIRIGQVIRGAVNADGNYEFEITFTDGVIMANRLELISDGTAVPVSDPDYTYGALYETAQDYFLSTYLIKTADLSQAQYDAGLYNATDEEGAASVSETGSPYIMFSSFENYTVTPVGGDDVYGNGVGWFRFADGGQTPKITVENGTEAGSEVGENTFTSEMVDSDVMIYRFKLADLADFENPEDYELSKITFRSKTWAGYRVALYVGDEDFEVNRDENGNDLSLVMTADEARTVDPAEWVTLACGFEGATIQGDYIDLDISKFIIGGDYNCDYIYIKVMDATDQDGQGCSVEGMYITGFYTYIGDFVLSGLDRETETGVNFALTSLVTVDVGYSTNLQTVLDSATYTIRDADGSVVETLTDVHTYTFTEAGTYTVEISCTDKNGNEASASATLTVAQGTEPAPPQTSEDDGESGGGCGGSEAAGVTWISLPLLCGAALCLKAKARR